MGTFKALCKIGLIETIVEFHVMDITPNYNLLLGRVWLILLGLFPLLYIKNEDPMEGGNCYSA